MLLANNQTDLYSILPRFWQRPLEYENLLILDTEQTEHHSMNQLMILLSLVPSQECQFDKFDFLTVSVGRIPDQVMENLPFRRNFGETQFPNYV